MWLNIFVVAIAGLSRQHKWWWGSCISLRCDFCSSPFTARAGIKSCKPGGSVVYSTCTLAAAQNDGVVQAAAEELWETSNIDIAVEDLSPLRTAFAPVFKFHSAVRLGQLVLPTLTSNFGPMYFCKLKRLQWFWDMNFEKRIRNK